MIADYYFIRRKNLDVKDLYELKGQYTYQNGFNKFAIIALIIGILPNVPGFLTTVGLVSSTAFPHWIDNLYNYAWFVGFGVSFVIYYFLMRNKTNDIFTTEIHSHRD